VYTLDEELGKVKDVVVINPSPKTLLRSTTNILKASYVEVDVKKYRKLLGKYSFIICFTYPWF